MSLESSARFIAPRRVSLGGRLGGGEPNGLACALRSLRPNGLCVGVTIYLQDPHIPYFTLYTKGARFVTGRVNARAAMPAVLELLQADRIHPLIVSQAVLPFDSALEAFREPTLKPVFIRMQ